MKFPAPSHLPRPLSALIAALLLAHAAWAQTVGGGPALEEQLRGDQAEALVAEAAQSGDPTRGAIVFFQPYLACTKCHMAGEETTAKMLGPDVARLGPESTAIRLVEGILEPSKEIRKGFEPITIVTADGKTLTGIVIEQTDEAILLADPSADGKTVKIAKADIEETTTGKVSLMPAGLVNQLASRQQFLDLVAYLVEISKRGPARALELKPAPALYAAAPLPEYEQHLDHAGLIRGWDGESLKRGEAIYRRVCANCHGTLERVGSLPTALRFGAGKFKNGSDPWAMYQTLTRGFGLMVPQTWMTPGQKYDVIAFIREAYLKEHNPSQLVDVDAAYLDRLPQGDTFGPEASKIEPWVVMDYGPSLTGCYEIGSDGSTFAHKGIAIRLDEGSGGVSRGRNWLVFDTGTLRTAAAWSTDAGQPGFIDWEGINFNGRHEVHPRAVGNVSFAARTGPGWANPTDGRFDDPRQLGRDGRHYGPLPKSWGKFHGYYQHGNRIVLSYRIGDAEILETPSLIGQSGAVGRTFRIGPRSQDLWLDVAEGVDAAVTIEPIAGETKAISFGPALGSPTANQSPNLSAAIVPNTAPVEWSTRDGRLLLKISKGDQPLDFTIAMGRGASGSPGDPLAGISSTKFVAPQELVGGGPSRWPERLATDVKPGPTAGPFAADIFALPTDNPWSCQLRPTGFDFFADGDRAAICAWDGDVWLVSGLKRLAADPPAGASSRGQLEWRRIASGLFQPLGLKIVDGQVFVTCRDQIAILRDLNGDGETDFYECFNDDHQVTDHYHEFAMGLQTDSEGNFYYAKSARHALPAVVPQHGTLLRVSRDGSRTEILATGFRAANGVCLNGDGTFLVTDQEGHWIPQNRINWVEPGGFYGNMLAYTDVTDSSDSAMRRPLCWVNKELDRSPAELLWVTSDRWGALKGSLLNLSYGYGKIFVVPHERVAGQWQGGVCPLPLPPFGAGVMRGRFHPLDGALYTCGMFAWAGSVTEPGGFYRVRHTGGASYLPLELHAKPAAVSIVFDGALEDKTSSDVQNISAKVWSIHRTAEYGSDRFDEKPLTIAASRLSPDGRTLSLDVPDLAPTQCLEIKYTLRSADGSPVVGTIQGTVHHLTD